MVTQQKSINIRRYNKIIDKLIEKNKHRNIDETLILLLEESGKYKIKE